MTSTARTCCLACVHVVCVDRVHASRTVHCMRRAMCTACSSRADSLHSVDLCGPRGALRSDSINLRQRAQISAASFWLKSPKVRNERSASAVIPPSCRANMSFNRRWRPCTPPFIHIAATTISPRIRASSDSVPKPYCATPSHLQESDSGYGRALA